MDDREVRHLYPHNRWAPSDVLISLLCDSLVIDPFDSNHWLYGTGLTVYGGRDLTSWGKDHASLYHFQPSNPV